MVISIIGLGKVGLCLAAAFAHREFDVIGYDVNPARTDALETGDATAADPMLNGFLERNAARLSGASSVETAVRNSEITFVVVPTPTNPSGGYDVEYCRFACRKIGQALREKHDYHLVVVASTLTPGATRFVLLPEIERASGRRGGPDFGLCYSPTFVALGQVIHDFLNPNIGLIGELDARSGSCLNACYAGLFSSPAPIKRMTIENAELTKIAVNSFVTAKIAFANLIGDLCEHLPGGDARVVAEAVGADPRIGPLCLKVGLGFGGPCFPRDNAAFAWFARSLGMSAPLAEATDDLNRARPSQMLKPLLKSGLAGKVVAVLGLAYKTGTNVLEGSQSLALIEELVRSGARIQAYDPLVSIPDSLGVPVVASSCGRECLTGAQVVVIALPDPGYYQEIAAFAENASNPLLIMDVWGMLGKIDNPLVTTIRVGRNFEEDEDGCLLKRIWAPIKENVT